MVAMRYVDVEERKGEEVAGRRKKEEKEGRKERRETRRKKKGRRQVKKEQKRVQARPAPWVSCLLFSSMSEWTCHNSLSPCLTFVFPH